jgi:hypothetical protein|tara:strand:+ start:48 stop:170 length:123 start_codon:yes stop_codon:yes gene_type:complete
MRDPHFSDETIAAFVFIFGWPWLMLAAYVMVDLMNRGGAA